MLRTGPPIWAMAAMVVGVAFASACSTDDRRTALAIDSATAGADGHIAVSTECAELDTVEIDIAPTDEGEELPRITLWGYPRAGRCQTTEVVDLRDVARSPVDQVVDGTTGEIVAVG